MGLLILSWFFIIVFGTIIAGLLFSEDWNKAAAIWIVLCIMMLVTSCTASFNGVPIPTGEGEHTGYVTAVENAGVIWKAKRAYIKTDTQSSQEDKYCVLDPLVFAQLQKFAETKAHVRIYHVSQLVFSLTRCNDEDAAIVRVMPVEP